ncbi:hypothetical protein GCM10022404_19250 [Celeribacter arenosi]|uniref:Uncharacterized protein n=1 Tax=Celeribacter arenosi TaxID=792649 RepID=A0ABP7K8E5_9RHOB
MVYRYTNLVKWAGDSQLAATAIDPHVPVKPTDEKFDWPKVKTGVGREAGLE